MLHSFQSTTHTTLPSQKIGKKKGEGLKANAPIFYPLATRNECYILNTTKVYHIFLAKITATKASLGYNK